MRSPQARWNSGALCTDCSRMLCNRLYCCRFHSRHGLRGKHGHNTDCFDSMSGGSSYRTAKSLRQKKIRNCLININQYENYFTSHKLKKEHHLIFNLTCRYHITSDALCFRFIAQYVYRLSDLSVLECFHHCPCQTYRRICRLFRDLASLKPFGNRQLISVKSNLTASVKITEEPYKQCICE